MGWGLGAHQGRCDYRRRGQDSFGVCQLATCQNLLVWIPSILLVPCISWWNCERSDVGNQRCPDPSFTQDWYPFIFGQKIPIISVPSSALCTVHLPYPPLSSNMAGHPEIEGHMFVDVGNSSTYIKGGFSRPFFICLAQLPKKFWQLELVSVSATTKFSIKGAMAWSNIYTDENMRVLRRVSQIPERLRGHHWPCMMP